MLQYCNDTRVNWCYGTVTARSDKLYMTPYETRSMRELAASRSRPLVRVSVSPGIAPRGPYLSSLRVCGVLDRFPLSSFRTQPILTALRSVTGERRWFGMAYVYEKLMKNVEVMRASSLDGYLSELPTSQRPSCCIILRCASKSAASYRSRRWRWPRKGTTPSDVSYQAPSVPSATRW